MYLKNIKGYYNKHAFNARKIVSLRDIPCHTCLKDKTTHGLILISEFCLG